MKIIPSIILLVGAFSVQLVTATSQTTVYVDYPNGASILGKTGSGVDAFLGIRYATVGERFSRSTKFDLPENAVTNATAFGPNCHQGYPGLPEFIHQPRPEAEECLYMNIWRPENVILDDPLAIMVWIHGGGFMIGSGADSIYDGANLARDQNVMVVSINYRLGALGFLAQDENGTGAMNGLFDQLVALQWLQSNAAGLGGNPDEVTVFGESSGGESICMLSVSPLAKGLFSRVIVQSGECMNNPYLNGVPNEDIEFALDAVANLMNATGVSSLEQLKDASLVDASSLNLMSAAMGWPTIVLDREILPMHPQSLYLDPQNIVPSAFVVGSNSNEDITFMGVAPETYLQLAESSLNESIQSLVGGKYGSQVAMNVWESYNSEQHYQNDTVAAFSQFHGDWYIRCPSRAYASRLAATAPGEVYLYNFAHFSITDPIVHFGLAPFVNTTSWASHLSMTPYAFGNMENWVPAFVNTSLSQQDWDMSHEIMARFASFAKYGNPNADPKTSSFAQWQPLPEQNTVTTSNLRTSSTAELSTSDIGATLPVLVFENGSGQMATLPDKAKQCATFPYAVHSGGDHQSEMNYTNQDQGDTDAPASSSSERNHGWFISVVVAAGAFLFTFGL